MQLYMTQGLHRAMQIQPDGTAVIGPGRTMTYAELGDRVARLAGALRTLGVQAGDRVGLLALNSGAYLEAYLAVWWVGAVVNPVNIRWSVAEIAYSLDDCDTRLLFVDDAFAALTDELRARSRCLSTLLYCGTSEKAPSGMQAVAELLRNAAPCDDAMRSGDELAGVFYTGGTTGFPKGVMLSHNALQSNALMAIAEVPLPRDAVVLTVAPAFHLAALSMMLRALLRALPQAFLPSFTPVGFMEAVVAKRATHTLLVPTMIQMIVDHPDVGRYDLSSLRQIAYGASPISEALLARAMKTLPSAEFAQGYGMTEMSCAVSFLHGRDHAGVRLRSAGQSICGVDVAIVDVAGRRLPAGEVGEIVARGMGMMSGYWNRPEESAQALRDGWMHTGDVGYLDAAGYLFIVDRLKDMIVSGGENVHSVEVENALGAHPDVAACAVIGIPHDKWGEAVHAVVVLKPGATADAETLMAYCHTRIAGYKCPRSVEFRERLPMSAAGKVLKTELREPHWKARPRAIG